MRTFGLVAVLAVTACSGRLVYLPEGGTAEGTGGGRGGAAATDVEGSADGPHSGGSASAGAAGVCLRTPTGIRAAEELHVVGVYEAGGFLPAREANRKGEVAVTVGRTDKPVTLALSSYEGVRWRIVREPGATVARVVVRSYYIEDTEVVGLEPETPVERTGRETGQAYAYGWEPEANTGGGSYRDMIAALRKRFGVETSFQGIYQGSTFRVPYDAASLASSEAPARSAGYRVSHYSSADQRCDGKCDVADAPGGFWRSDWPGASVTLGAGGQSITANEEGPGGMTVVKGARGRRCGKVYFELDVTTLAGRGATVGVTWKAEGTPRPLTAPETMGQSLHDVRNERVGVALDLDEGRVFYRRANGWAQPGMPWAPAEYGSRPASDPAIGAVGAELNLWTYEEMVPAADLPGGATLAYYGRPSGLKYGIPPGYTAADPE